MFPDFKTAIAIPVKMIKKQKQRPRVLEIDALRCKCKISKLQHIPNDINIKMGVEENIIERIEKKRIVWYGHLIRMEDHNWSRNL